MKPRTLKQNNSFHLWFSQLAKALNQDGYDMRVLISEGIDIPWSAWTVKEHLWRPLQQEMFGKKSTTELTTDEIDKIYDSLNKIIGERTGIHIPFPSEDETNN